MASYGQWQASFAKNGPARCTWVCGAERLLVDEVTGATWTAIARIQELESDQVVFCQAGSDPESGIWDLVLDAPHGPWRRVVVIRDAGRLRRLDHLEAWFASRLPIWIVFQDNAADFPKDDAGKLTRPATWLRDSTMGQLVRCSPLDVDAAVAWARRQLPRLSEAQARRLLVRASGDLAEVRSVLFKAALFDGQVTDAALDLLCAELPGEFADLLVLGRPREAMRAAGVLDESRLRAALGLLASRLETLSLLHKAERDKVSRRDVITRLGVAPFLVQKFSGVAKDYGEQRVSRSWLALAAAEDAVRSGARDGVAEALVLSW